MCFSTRLIFENQVVYAGTQICYTNMLGRGVYDCALFVRVSALPGRASCCGVMAPSKTTPVAVPLSLCGVCLSVQWMQWFSVKYLKTKSYIFAIYVHPLHSILVKTTATTAPKSQSLRKHEWGLRRLVTAVVFKSVTFQKTTAHPAQRRHHKPKRQ